jgi:2-oxoglutarate dehydrogenase E1 component
MTSLLTYHADYIDAQYRRWKNNAQSVPPDWGRFFEGFELGRESAPGDLPPAPGEARGQARVEALRRRYRELGHLLACMDPLSACPVEHPLLDLEAFGLTPDDLPRSFGLDEDGEGPRASLREILQTLRQTYCRSVGVEYMHLQDPGERRWLQERMEPTGNRTALRAEERRRIWERLSRAALLEQFLNRRYVGVTRFSLEGGDGLIPMLDALARHLAASGAREIVLGMAHRGRLNVQAHLLERPYREILSEFEHCYDAEDVSGTGDVKYHNGYLTDVALEDGRSLRICLLNNPSHLEVVGPVVQGLARGRQGVAGEDADRRVIPLLLHGDAAFAGQGVVMESLNMSQLAGYRTGGTIHVVINNQIGYTTLPADARSTRYSTDVAKMLMIPIFHVHGEDPEALVHVARLAADYRMAFGKDVVIDLVCYRRYGHNEGDEPYFTQPQMVERIRERPSPHVLYAEVLEAEGLLDQETRTKLETAITQELEEAYAEVHGSACPFPDTPFFEIWDGYRAAFPREAPATGVAGKTLVELSTRLNRVPEGFRLNDKLVKLMERRHKAVAADGGIDWANAEALALASLLGEGVPVRLSGQDSARGTFSQRHSVWFDVATGTSHTPLNNLGGDQAPYEVCNSLLAEYSVLGFEYGYSLARPEVLVMWEAQFGDFINNAQAVVDLFLASGEAKWRRLSGLTLLLPHGYEGQGPEHSSARPERFLELCADDNMQVCYPSTPAQYFHLLRRQARWKVRKPLVVLTPKSLLRNPNAVSGRAQLAEGRFQRVLEDPEAPRKPRRILLCAGKIYYELARRREALERDDTALVRLEQFYPFPAARLQDVRRHAGTRAKWFWVQEEPENMGAWWFLRPRLEAALQQVPELIGRPAAASPATGFPAIYRQQQEAILTAALGPAPDDKGTGRAVN